LLIERPFLGDAYVTINRMNNTDMGKVIRVLRQETRKFQAPVVTLIAQTKENPYGVLISCLLSLRTKDETTTVAFKRLSVHADSPEKMVKLKAGLIEKLIYPVGFYRVKARNLIDVSRTILDRFDGKVPDDLDDLLTLKGVGRKTANLVRTLGYRKLGICVDTHVHRISNRLGYIKTKNPNDSEFALRKKLPKQYWIEYNDLLVAYGQNHCKPISPHCSTCKVHRMCARTDVAHSR